MALPGLEAPSDFKSALNQTGACFRKKRGVVARLSRLNGGNWIREIVN